MICDTCRYRTPNRNCAVALAELGKRIESLADRLVKLESAVFFDDLVARPAARPVGRPRKEQPCQE